MNPNFHRRTRAAGAGLAMALLLVIAAPVASQDLGGMLKHTVKRAAQSEVQRRADQETRRATRCALGDDRCAREARQRGEQVETAGAAPRGVADHPLLPRYAGSDILLYQSDDYTDYALRTGKAQASGTHVLEGKVTRITYRAPANRSALEVFRNYENALREAGFQTLFTCTKAACGDIKKQIESDKRYLLFWGDGGHHYLAAKLARPQGDAYVAVYSTRNGSGGESRNHAITQVDVIEMRGMDDNLAAIDADALGDALGRDGRVALHGILFDTDQDTLRPESAAQLEQIAQLLRRQPALSIRVIGHTDATGSPGHNRQLSQRRAARVVATLAGDYGIARSRMEALGLGAEQPMADNASEQGRALNRRVEIVKR